MKNNILCVVLSVLLLACSFEEHAEYKYTIVSQERQGQQQDAYVALSEKYNPDQLKEIAAELKGKVAVAKDYQFYFTVPSAYPDYPEEYWARSWWPSNEETPSIFLYGSYPDQQDSLLRMQPSVNGKLIGRWHLNEPQSEEVFFIFKVDSEYFAEVISFSPGWSNTQNATGESHAVKPAFDINREIYPLSADAMNNVFTSEVGGLKYSIDSLGDVMLQNGNIARKY